MIKGSCKIMEKDNNIKRARMNIYLVQELKDYVDTQARNFGLSTSAYMTMLIQNYRLQNEALASMSNVDEMIKKLEQLNSVSENCR